MQDEMKRRQCRRVMDYMRRNGSITQMEATMYLSVQWLASRVYDLRADGVKIKGTMVSAENKFGEKTRFMRYTLIDYDGDGHGT